MPEIVNVISGETIASEWGNDIRDRTVQRYADVATRTAQHPTPGAGDLAYLADSGDVDVFHGGAWRHLGTPTGSLQMFGGTTAPDGWLVCQGQAISRTTYARLFAVLGTTYGAGDGTTTFNLPDMRQRFPLGKAASGTGATLGETGGAVDHRHSGPSHTHAGGDHTHSIGTHGTTSAGSHDHAVSGSAAAAGSHGHSFSDTTSAGSTSWNVPITGGTAVSADGHTHTVSGTTGSTGSHGHTVAATAATEPAHAHSVTIPATAVGSATTDAGGTGNTGANNPPYLAVYFIVKT